MKKLFLLSLLFLSISQFSCKKADKEAQLVLKLVTDNPAKSTSNSHTFKIEITSKLPASGVEITVDVKREDNNAQVYSLKYTATQASTDVTITGLPSGQTYCVANVSAVSLSTPTNTWAGSFRVLWK
jgi:hypothetical protein